MAKRLYFKYAARFPKITQEQRRILERGSPEQILDLFNALFNTLSYENYPIRDEATLRACLHCFFIGADIDVTVEKENSKGRSDLELNLPDRRLVIELKYVGNSSDADQALGTAVSQIRARDYGNTLPRKQELRRLAMVFDGTKDVRAFVRCAEA